MRSLPTMEVGTVLSFDVGIRNLAFCLMTPDDRIAAWELLDIADPAGKPGKLTVRTSSILYAALEERWAEFAPADVVVLEKQPPKNAIMRVVQGMLEMYFVAHGKRVEVFDAKQKLAASGAGPKLSGSKKYRERKKEAVAVCRRFLEGTRQEDWCAAVLDKTKKADDLSDSLVQALRFREIAARQSATPSARSGGGREVSID